MVVLILSVYFSKRHPRAGTMLEFQIIQYRSEIWYSRIKGYTRSYLCKRYYLCESQVNVRWNFDGNNYPSRQEKLDIFYEEIRKADKTRSWKILVIRRLLFSQNNISFFSCCVTGVTLISFWIPTSHFILCICIYIHIKKLYLPFIFIKVPQTSSLSLSPDIPWIFLGRRCQRGDPLCILYSPQIMHL